MSMVKRNALRVLLLGVALCGASATAYAHEKWFVDSIHYPPQFGLLFSWPVLLMILLACAGVGSLYGLRYLVGGDNQFPSVVFLRYYDRSNQVILGVQTAISLIFVAAGLHVFAINLEIGNIVLAVIFAALQIIAAFTFISGLLTRVGALIIIGVFLLSFLFFPFWAVWEQALYPGIALYLLIMGRGLIRPGPHQEPLASFGKYWHIAPTCLRVGVGISFTVLAFTEKLLNPQLALAFLRDYPAFNLAQVLGLTWFTNERFILAAGAVELIIGLALICGVLPKVVIMGMFVPVNLPLPFLPPTELIGHLPIFAAMYVLLFLPPGRELQYMVGGLTRPVAQPEIKVTS